jgi:hypothetical protein
MNCRLIRELKTYSSANRLLLTGTPLQVSPPISLVQERHLTHCDALSVCTCRTTWLNYGVFSTSCSLISLTVWTCSNHGKREVGNTIDHIQLT